jgi:predicted ATPase
MGDVAKARPHLERVIPLYEPGAPNVTDLRYSQDHAIWSLSALALALWPLGYPEQAAAAAAKSLSWAHTVQHAMTTGFALWTASTLNAFCGADVLRRGAHSEEALTYCIDHDLKAYIPFAQFYHGWTLFQCGEHREGLDLMRAGMLGSEQISMNLLRATHLGLLACAHGRVGEIGLGLELLDSAIGTAEATDERIFEAELHRLRGELLIQSERSCEAGREFREAMIISRRQQAKMWELRAATSLARLRGQQGRSEQARELLAPIYDWFTEGLDTTDLKEAHALLAELT